jgi:hypothetical protein
MQGLLALAEMSSESGDGNEVGDDYEEVNPT